MPLFFVPIENLQQRFADVEGHQLSEEVESVLTPARLLCLPELDSEYLLHALKLLLITNFKNFLPLVPKVHNVTCDPGLVVSIATTTSIQKFML